MSAHRDSPDDIHSTVENDAYAGLRMSAHRDSPDDIHSTVDLLTLRISRYCLLVLQSCTVAAVPVIEHRVCRCHGASISRIR